MSNYDINNINTSEFMQNGSENDGTRKTKKTQLGMAILAGLGAAVIVAILLAVIGIATKSEFFIALVIGAVLVGYAIKQFVPEHSIGGAIIGAILCPLTYFLYQSFMAIFGYYYEEDGEFTFWMLLIGSAIYGAYICYSKTDD